MYGGLQPGEKTLVGRLVHGGGVAVQELDPVEKQRAMHPSLISKEKGDDPMPFKRQYNEPGLLYPVYNHCLSVTDDEFTAVAYAFLDSLVRIGAGNPKGVKIFEHSNYLKGELLLVVDRYLAPLGKRPIVSPSLNNVDTALKQFTDAVSQVKKGEHFERRVGNDALAFLQEQSAKFVKLHLTKTE